MDSKEIMHKIAVVIPKYGLTGGAEQFASELTGRLSLSTSYHFHVYANQWKKSSLPLIFHKTPIISFPKFLTTPSFAFFAQHRISRDHFSLVHSHERIYKADIYTIHGIPHKYWVHHVRRKSMSLYDLATARVEKKLVYEGHCKIFIAVSSLTKDIFLQEYEIDPDQVVVIHPGVDFNDYEKHDKASIRHTIRREWGIHPAELVMIFVSMNFEIKGLDEILPALAKLKAWNHPFKLVVVGKGNIHKYKNLAQKAQIGQDVIFTGPLSKENLIKMYLAGDLYLMLSKFDTFGMVVLEAMAAGLPVMISNHVGARDIVREGENGFIIDDTSDVESIAARAALFFNEGVRRKMSAAAQQTAAQNTWDTVAEKYRNIYDKILSDQKKSTVDV
jgi:UDP-glucose:(heptosyl)LPS alpha-1,3-glucosyltransferase